MTTNRGSILMLSLHSYAAVKPELRLPDTGGQITFVIELARRFARLGYQVDVVTRQCEGQRATERLNAGTRILRIPFGGKEFISKEDMHNHLTEFVTNFITTAARSGTRYEIVNSHYWDAGGGASASPRSCRYRTSTHRTASVSGSRRTCARFATRIPRRRTAIASTSASNASSSSTAAPTM